MTAVGGLLVAVVAPRSFIHNLAIAITLAALPVPLPAAPSALVLHCMQFAVVQRPKALKQPIHTNTLENHVIVRVPQRSKSTRLPLIDISFPTISFITQINDYLVLYHRSINTLHFFTIFHNNEFGDSTLRRCQDNPSITSIKMNAMHCSIRRGGVEHDETAICRKQRSHICSLKHKLLPLFFPRHMRIGKIK